MLSALPPFNCELCAVFSLPPKKCFEAFFFELCEVRELGQAPQMLSAPSPSMFDLCKLFHCPRKSHARFFRMMQGLGAGQGSADAIRSVLLHFSVMHGLLLPKTDSCKVFYFKKKKMQGLRAGQGSAEAICSVPLHAVNNTIITAQEKIMHVFLNYARFASKARLRRCFQPRPPSFSNCAESCTPKEKIHAS